MCVNRCLINRTMLFPYSLLLIFALSLLSCDKESPIDEYGKDIIIDGNLCEVISYDNMKIIERLTIKGNIYPEDWNIIFEMALTGKLSYLDMTEARILGCEDVKTYNEDEIPSYQFTGSRTLQTVLLPKNLKGIGTEAFASCSNLNTIVFSTSLRYIGDEAFTNCSKLSSIELPQSIDSIGARAFYKTALVGDFVLPDGLRIVAKQAFAQTNITSVKITHDVYAAIDTKMYTINNNSVFASCKNLKKVQVDEGCTRLEVGFTNCESLTEVSLPSTLKYIGGNSKSTHNYIFKDCKSLNHIILPKGLTYIGMYAFDSASFQTLDIPETVQYIGEYSFRKAKIPTVKVYWNRPINIGSHTFESFDFDNSVLCVPTNTSNSYKAHEFWGLFSEIIEM